MRPQDSYTDILKTQSNSIKKWGPWEDKDGILDNGISALIKDPRELLTPFWPCEETEKTAIYEPGGRPLSNMKSATTLLSQTLQPPKLEDINISCLNHADTSLPPNTLMYSDP